MGFYQIKSKKKETVKHKLENTEAVMSRESDKNIKTCITVCCIMCVNKQITLTLVVRREFYCTCS